MGWSSGTFTITTTGTPVTTGTTISSTVQNNFSNELAAGINQCVNKDGSNAWTGNLNAAGFRITSLGAATAVSDAARASQVQNSSMQQLASVSGASTIVGVATPTPAAYAEGQTFSFIAVGANAAGPTLNVSSIGALPIFWAGSTCTSSMWSTGSRLDVTYLSTSSQTGFHIMGHSGFMPANLLRLRGTIPSGDGAGGVELNTPSADDQILVSTASASAGVAFKAFDHFAATQAQMEAATSTANFVPPVRQQFHPSAAKAWAKVDASNGALNASYNVAAASANGGNLSLDWSSGFSSSNYVLIATALFNGGVRNIVVTVQTSASASFRCNNSADGTATPTNWFIVAYGDI
jgi:hypothetical protein